MNSEFISRLLEIFDVLDYRTNGPLTFTEMTPMLRLISTREQMQLKIFALVDQDKSGQIDFAEFLYMVHLLKVQHGKAKETLQQRRDEESSDSGNTYLSFLGPDNKGVSRSMTKSLKNAGGKKLTRNFFSRVIEGLSTPVYPYDGRSSPLPEEEEMEVPEDIGNRLSGILHQSSVFDATAPESLEEGVTEQQEPK